MCFDCLLAFPPFGPSASAGVKKSLIKVSRSRSTSPKPQSEDHYGPPLKHDLNQEDLPEENVTKLGTAAVDDGDSGTYNTHETESETSMSMDPSTGVELDAVALVDVDPKDSSESSVSASTDPSKPEDSSYVYEQDIEVEIEEEETSLDEQLPIGSGDEDKNGTLEPTKIQTTQRNIVGHLEVILEYEDAGGGRLKVAVMKASNLPNKKAGGFDNYRVRLSLRPNKQQSSKTRIRPVDSPVFRELFRFRQLPKEELPVLELFFKLHGCGKFGKERLVGDAILNLSAMKAAAKQTFNIPLVQRDE